jgi:hypothetical protein
MGLDVRIVKIREEHVDMSKSIENLYKEGTYVSEYRNIWDLLMILTLTRKELDTGVCYRIINDLPIFRLRNRGIESEHFLEMYKKLDKNKFVYILKADW